MIIIYCETVIYEFTVHIQHLQSPERLNEWTVNTVKELFVSYEKNDVDIDLVSNSIYSIYSIYNTPGENLLLKVNIIIDRQLLD